MENSGKSKFQGDINDGWEAGEESHKPTMSDRETLSPLSTNEDFKRGPCF